jgi:regulator of sirC expression with transglutaminase-like and TPR domain
MREALVRSFANAALGTDADVAMPALLIARIEYPTLDVRPYLNQLDAFGREAGLRLGAAGVASKPNASRRVDVERHAQVLTLNRFLFDELKFTGNTTHYGDPRNSFLNEVLDRRTGIPISLAVVYMEVARRAGLTIEGINFPGHFLLRCPARTELGYAEDLIIDAFHGGAILSKDACRVLLRRHEGDDLSVERHLAARATKRQILARMLVNLKQLYVQMNSFPQARDVTELLLAIDPTATNELRDRGLIAYHLNDFSSALRDLQAYLALAPAKPQSDEDRQDHERIVEHVKTLRRRVATFN